MMENRIKLQVFVTQANRWKTAYVRADMLRVNVILMRKYGIQFRIGGDRAGI